MAETERRVVHLQLYKEGGAPSLRWSSPPFQVDWQNDLALAAAKTSLEFLADRPDRPKLVALATKLLNALSSWITGQMDRAKSQPVACTAGCDHCCHQIVGATPAELLVIVDHLRGRDGNLALLAARARELAQRAQGVPPRERFSRKHPCLFLLAGSCTIYDVRPLACRGANALDSDACRRILDDPERRRQFWEEGLGSPGYVEPSEAALALSAGLQLAGSEIYGLATHPVDLTLAMNKILNAQGDLLAAWSSGNDPFADERSGHWRTTPLPQAEPEAPSSPPLPPSPSPPPDARAAPNAPLQSLGHGDPSSLLSSRWPDDNLLTCHPGRLYSGSVKTDVPVSALRELLGAGVPSELRPAVQTVRMGVVTWDLICGSTRGEILVQIPRALDEVSAAGRQRSTAPRKNVQNLALFERQGLKRYISLPLGPARDLSGLTVSAVEHDARFFCLTFGSGRAQLDCPSPKGDWVIRLGPKLTAEILTELVAAIAYHYDPNEDGGTTISDLFLNDGDFRARRTIDGSVQLRLTSIRYRQGQVSPERLILYLAQLAYFQDFQAGPRLLGVPGLLSSPTLAFRGLCRGRRHRAEDLGEGAEQGEEEARGWIEAFMRGQDGKSYAPWAEPFLRQAPPEQARPDPRAHWWRVTDLEEKAGMAELRTRLSSAGASDAAKLSVALSSLAEGLASSTGKALDDNEAAGLINCNDLSPEDFAKLLTSAGEAAPKAQNVANALVKSWPFRNLDHLLAEAPRASRLRKLRPRLHFGEVVRAEEDSDWRRITRHVAPGAVSIANHELVDASRFPPREVGLALSAFDTFERFTDAALQDPTWGYYARHVVIGRGGHFTTRPEKWTPHYGRWICVAAFHGYSALRQSGALGPGLPYHLVEFGAGTGRLAADILAASQGPAPHPSCSPELWRDFGRALNYRIYENSDELRAQQLELLGRAATVCRGDARNPASSLAADFPSGFVGMFVTNEVPDAFGTHKVLLTEDGQALACLTLPRVALAGSRALGSAWESAAREADAKIRRHHAFATRKNCLYLDARTFGSAMCQLAGLPDAERRRSLLAFSMSEGYVPARLFPSLQAHLKANLEPYARALAEATSGVVLYPNSHADRFIRELGESMRSGYVLTIDYGDTAHDLVRRARRGEFLFRVYCDGSVFEPVANDPYTRLGLQDLTTDVNFTALALAGELGGLAVEHFGPERDVAGPFLQELALRSDPDTEEFLGAPAFKALMLSKMAPKLPAWPLATPLPLFAERAAPSTGLAQRCDELKAALLANLLPDDR